MNGTRIRGILWSVMPSQVVYQTNADWIASQEAMVKNCSLVKADMTAKGLLWFKFKDSQTVFQLSPMGKLQVKWNDEHEKRTLYKLVKNLLVAKPNEKIMIKPLKQQMWIEYPVPESFKLYWCDQATEFVLKEALETKEKEKRKSSSSVSRKAGNCQFKQITPAEVNLVREELKDLRRELSYLREPTIEAVARKSGIESKSQKPFLRVVDWRQQAIIEAEKGAEDAINIAGWLCWKKKNEKNRHLDALYEQAIGNASVSTINMAQKIARDFPNLAARITSQGIEWSTEITDRWRLIFRSEPPVPYYWR